MRYFANIIPNVYGPRWVVFDNEFPIGETCESISPDPIVVWVEMIEAPSSIIPEEYAQAILAAWWKDRQELNKVKNELGRIKQSQEHWDRIWNNDKTEW